PIIDGIANGIRYLNIDVRSFVANIGSSFKPAIADFFKLLKADFSGIEAPQIGTGWLKDLHDGVIGVGNAIVAVFDGVIKPAFVGAKVIAEQVASTVNELFGTKLTAAIVGVTG